MFQKYATVEQVLETKTFDTRMKFANNEEAGDRLVRFAAAKDTEKTDDGYLYVRCRAISSRVNKNNDGWPAEELAKAYKSFIGKPIFVDHNNEDPKRTRGVIVDAQLHVEDADKASAFDPYYATAPDNHKPPTWIELLMEIDAETYPKLAKAIKKGEMDSVSMGANIEKSVCSVCANEAATPSEYCSHVKQKGSTFEITSDNGERVKKKAYEDCYGVGFFEISNVFDPADPTADSWLDQEKAARIANAAKDRGLNPREVLAYIGMKDEGILAKAASTGKPLTKDFVEKLALSYPDDPNEQDQVVAVMRQIIEADQIGDMNEVNRLKAQLAHMLGGETQMMAALASYNLDRVSFVKQALPADQFIKPVDQVEPKGERNYEPQYDQTTAPQKVDTLRSESRCPICRAADMETDPDGIMRCPTCGHVQEPDPVDNPDLSLARDVDLRQDVSDSANTEGDPQTPADNPLDAVEFSPMGQQAPVAATKNSTSGEGISEMFTTLLRTSNKDEAVAALSGEIKIAREELKLGANGIHRGVYDAAREAGLKVKVSYPAVDDPENFVEIPGDNGVFNLFFAQESAAKLKVDVAEVPIVVEADSKENLDKFTEILATAVRPEKRSRRQAADTILPSDAKPSDEPKDQTVISDEHEPRETKTVTVTEDVVEMDGKSFKLVEITDGDEAEKPKSETDEEPTDEKPAEAVDTSKAEDLADEVADEDDKESKLLAAFKIADMAVELGLVENENKMAFIAELEEDSLDKLSAREATMLAVKTAGLSKSAKRVNGIKRVPRLSHTVIASNGGTTNDLPDEALFL